MDALMDTKSVLYPLFRPRSARRKEDACALILTVISLPSKCRTTSLAAYGSSCRVFD